jgi:hypothetical protein
VKKVQPKKGLLEVLGFVYKKGERYVLCHELFPYYSRQTSIDNFSFSSLGGEAEENRGLEAGEK